MNPYLLQKLRTARNLSRDQVAKSLGLKSNTYWFIESGARGLGDVYIDRLSLILGCSPELLNNAPQLLTDESLLFYIKQILKNARGLELHKTDSSVILCFTDPNDLLFLDTWRALRLKRMSGEITDQEYFDWIFKRPKTRNKDNAYTQKFQYYRKKREFEDPGINARLCRVSGKNFYEYLKLENGERQASKAELLALAEALGTIPEVLTDSFEITSRQDLETFLITLDISYPDSIRLADGGFVQFTGSFIQSKLESLYTLFEKRSAGSISKNLYETELLKC